MLSDDLVHIDPAIRIPVIRQVLPHLTLNLFNPTLRNNIRLFLLLKILREESIMILSPFLLILLRKTRFWHSETDRSQLRSEEGRIPEIVRPYPVDNTIASIQHDSLRMTNSPNIHIHHDTVRQGKQIIHLQKPAGLCNLSHCPVELALPLPMTQSKPGLIKEYP